METLEITLYANPFPLMVVDNFYNEEELELIWEELKFYTKQENACKRLWWYIDIQMQKHCF